MNAEQQVQTRTMEGVEPYRLTSVKSVYEVVAIAVK